MDFVPRFDDNVRPRAAATDDVGVVDLAASVAFWSAFNLLGILFTRDSRWLSTDGAAAVAAGAEGSAVDAEGSILAGLYTISARLLRTLCTGQVLRARAADGDTEPDIVHANNTSDSVKTDYFPLVVTLLMSRGNLCTLHQCPNF